MQKTFVNVGVEVAVLLGVSSSLPVILIYQDTHLRQKLHLLMVQFICVYLWHLPGQAVAS